MQPGRRRLGTRCSALGTGGLVLGLVCAATALAQPPAGGGRAAVLLPPQPAGPSEVPGVARAAADDSFPVSTPVTRPGVAKGPTPGPAPGRTANTPSGPAWLNGTDPNLVPAAGTRPAPPASSPQPKFNFPSSQPSADPGAVQRAVEKLKVPSGPERPFTMGGSPATNPTGPNAPNATTPFRTSGPNGAPVYAGPPAYRWYGYGTVTPGGNPFAPTGEYPRASANWYSVTGATPGAFPVPVMNPLRPAPGSEPPTYVHTPTRNPAPPGGPTPVAGIAGAPPGMTMIPDYPAAGTAPPRVAPPPAPASGEKFAPLPPTEPPRIVPPTGPTQPLPVPTLPPSVGVPTIAAPPGSPLSAGPVPQPMPVQPEPLVVVPPIPPVNVAPPEPVAPVLPSPVAATKPAAVPETLPPSVTSDDVRWQPRPGENTPPPGTWVPAAPMPVPQPTNGGGFQPGASRAAPVTGIVARGQAPDRNPQPDAVVTLIESMCRGRASGIDVRWTGSQKLTVCFETRTDAEATRLVKDLSARPELAPLQIDFCVLVK